MRPNFLAFLASVVLTLGVATAVSAQSSYKIKPGDVLEIEVLEDPSLNRQALVLPDGSISFPTVGSVAARGRTVGQVQQTLTSGLGKNFATTPNVFVSVGKLSEPRSKRGPVKARTIDVFVMGEVASPGKLKIDPGTTLLQFLAQAGGLTKFAAKKRIELHRTDPNTGESKIYLFSYTGHANGPRIRGSIPLTRGDVVIVPERRLFE